MAALKLKEELQRKPERVGILMNKFLNDEFFAMVSPNQAKSWVAELEQFGYKSSDWNKKFKIKSIVFWNGKDWNSSASKQFYKSNLNTVAKQDNFKSELMRWTGSLGYNGVLGQSRQEVFIPDILLQKTPEFGSTGGSGAGAAATDLGESAQCVYLAAVQHNRHKPINDNYVRSNIKKFSNSFDITDSNDNVLNKMGIDWVQSSTTLANLWTKDSTFKKYLKPNKKYIFHRGSSMVNLIYKKYKELNKKLKVPFSNENKWSPADIWAFDSSVTSAQLSNDLNKMNSLEELNQYLLGKINNSLIVGMSLKKSVKNAHLDLFNMGEKKRDVNYKGYEIKSASKDIWSGKDVYLLFEMNGVRFKQQFRTFSTDGVSSWQSEIKGTNANLGKLSQGPLDGILSDLKIKTSTPTSEVKQMALNPEKYQNMLDDMYTWYSSLESGSKISKDDFTRQATNLEGRDGASWRYSKYYGLQILYNIKGKQKEFVREEVLLALSNSKFSAPFIKLS